MMKIINQSFDILNIEDTESSLKLLESYGRTCYKSEAKITEDSAEKFIKMIIDRGHESVLEHMFMTVRFVTDRGVSHELVRHRIASFSQESTRYCNYSDNKFGTELTFILPGWLYNMSEISSIYKSWSNSLLTAEKEYFALLNEGLLPQDARVVLPNSLKTEIVMTANFREWRYIFRLRAISKAAHPQMRDLMIPLYDHCRFHNPIIFDMGDSE